MKITKRLKELFNGGEITVAPGVFDGLGAKLVSQAGFKAVYASGGAIARSTGVPDIGLLSLDEVVKRVEQIADAVDLPVIADADTGFGNAINTQRTVRLFERAGAAAIHLEDQTFPKRCGHLNDKSLVTSEEMIAKIKAAKNAQLDSDFQVFARTDAIAVEGLQSAIDRSNRYVEAGADMIFVEAPTSLEDITRIAREVEGPLLINMFASGKTPLIPLPQLQELGYRLVIIPSDLQRASVFGMQTTLNAIQKYGDSGSVQDGMISFLAREELVDTRSYLELDELI